MEFVFYEDSSSMTRRTLLRKVCLPFGSTLEAATRNELSA
jgi:hypothetical protein